MNRLSMVRGGFLPISLLLAVAGVGCGDDGGSMVDMGRDLGGGTDLGPPADVGPEDEGVDLGPELPVPQVRVVHAVSDLLTASNVPIKGIRLCVEVAGLGVIAQPANANLLPDLFDLRDGLPFRAVTPYLDTLPMSTVRVYDEAVVDNDMVGATPPAVNCPTTGLDTNCVDDTVGCLFQFAYDPTALERGKFYSLVVDGFVNNTNTCGAGVACPTGAVGATLEEDEDATDVVAGSARVRFFQGIHNLPEADLCYDLDGLAGVLAPPTIIHAGALPGTLTGYVTVPVVTTGFVFLAVKTPGDPTILDADCALSAVIAPSTGLPSNVIPVFFSPANAMAMPPNVTPNVAAGTVLTIFATGDMRYVATPTMPPQDDPAGWANYAGRTVVPLAFFEVRPAAP